MIIKLNAGNDRNGNPRRVFVELCGNIINRVHDEGYSGDIKDYSGIEFATTPAEYRRLLRLGETIRKDKDKDKGKA